MKKRSIFAGAVVAAGVTIAAAGAWISAQPARENIVDAGAGQPVGAPPRLRPPVSEQDERLVVVLADSEGTETTDFMVPYGVLKEAEVAEVVTVSTEDGPIELMPALRTQADMSIAAFDRDRPAGADVVVVPAMHRQDNPAILEFLRQQHAKGALIVSICDGSWVVGNAGLLEGRVAATHWFSFARSARAFPGTTWVRNARYVSDERVMSSTGVSASVPISLALVEILADRTAAAETADRLGIDDWSSAHDSATFGASAGAAWVTVRNIAGFWRHETLTVEIPDGFDEIAVGLQADAWSRTGRSKLHAVHPDSRVTSARGLILHTQRAAAGDAQIATAEAPATALNEALALIAGRYDPATADLVALQLEYEWRDASPTSTAAPEAALDASGAPAVETGA